MFVANGADAGLDAIPDALRPYRYLLSPRLDGGTLDADALAEALDARLQDLGSPAADLVEPLVPSDPTLETLALAEAWRPATLPQSLQAWFDRWAGRRCCCWKRARPASTRTASARQWRRSAMRSTPCAADAGRARDHRPGRVRRRDRHAPRARRAGSAASTPSACCCCCWPPQLAGPLLGVLPLASAGLAGLAALMLLFGDRVHGITLAFGFTLIGVVQDYPIHFFSHQHAGLSPWRNVRRLWPALATGVAATCIAYLTFLFSGVDGLRQQAVFTIVALALRRCARWLPPA